MKLTKKKAKELCIRKWECIVDNNGIHNNKKLISVIPEIKSYPWLCAYCELYLDTESAKFDYCFECPLRMKYSKYYDLRQTGCLQLDHPLGMW